MRNQYADKCFLCKRPVSAGAGFFQRLGGRWVVRCKRCVGAGNSVEGRVTDEKLFRSRENVTLSACEMTKLPG